MSRAHRQINRHTSLNQQHHNVCEIEPWADMHAGQRVSEPAFDCRSTRLDTTPARRSLPVLRHARLLPPELGHDEYLSRTFILATASAAMPSQSPAALLHGNPGCIRSDGPATRGDGMRLNRQTNDQLAYRFQGNRSARTMEFTQCRRGLAYLPHTHFIPSGMSSSPPHAACCALYAVRRRRTPMCDSTRVASWSHRPVRVHFLGMPLHTICRLSFQLFACHLPISFRLLGTAHTKTLHSHDFSGRHFVTPLKIVALRWKRRLLLALSVFELRGRCSGSPFPQ